MLRTLLATIICLAFAILLGFFIVLGLSTAQIIQAATAGNFKEQVIQWVASASNGLMHPIANLQNGIFSSAGILVVSGFVSGLVGRSGTRTLIAILLSLCALFLAYSVLGGIAVLSIDALKTVALGMKTEIGLSFFLLFISGMIGTSLTDEN